MAAEASFTRTAGRRPSGVETLKLRGMLTAIDSTFSPCEHGADACLLVGPLGLLGSLARLDVTAHQVPGVGVPAPVRVAVCEQRAPVPDEQGDGDVRPWGHCSRLERSGDNVGSGTIRLGRRPLTCGGTSKWDAVRPIKLSESSRDRCQTAPRSRTISAACSP